MRKFFDDSKGSEFADISSIGIANVVGSAISAIFWLFIASIMSAENYGEISYFIAIASVVSAIGMIGGDYVVTVYTAKKIRVQSSIFLISLINAGIAASVLFVIFQYSSVSLYVIGYVIFNLAIAELLGRKSYKTYSKYFIIQKILLVGFSLPLFYAIGPQGVILGMALSFLPFINIIYQVFKNIKIDFTLLKPRLGFLLNNYGRDLAQTFSYQTDKIIVAPLFGFALLGNYYLGLQILAVLTLLPSVILQYILPQDATGKSNKKLKKIGVLISLGFAVIGFVVSPFIIPIFFPEFGEAVQIIQIVSLAIVPRTISAIFVSEFLGREKSKFVIIGSMIYLSIQIPSIFVLGEFLGIIGVAIALVLGEVFQAIFLFVSSRFTLESNEMKK